MTVKTQVVWANADLTQDLKSVIHAEVALLKDQGKTDGVLEYQAETPVAGQNTNIRTWIDQATAEQWIIFINSLQVAPVSTGIVPN